MIIWIDGTYGVGKTSVGICLQKIHPDLILMDSDEYFSRFLKDKISRGDISVIFGGTLPQNKVDFLNYFRDEIIKVMDKTVIVTMTLSTKESEDLLVRKCAVAGTDFEHIILEASVDVIEKRISADDNRDKSFSESYMHDNLRYLNSHYKSAFRINTDNRSSKEVAILIDEYLREHADKSGATAPWARKDRYDFTLRNGNAEQCNECT